MNEALIKENSAAIDSDLNRRDFISKVGHIALILGAGGLGALSLDFLSPNLLLEPPKMVKAGRPEEFAPGSVTLLSQHKVFIVRTEDGPFLALSAVCTHLGCMTGYRSSSKIIACPCHGSKFNPADDSVIDGPAPTPLPSLELTLSEKGNLWVNRTQIIEPGRLLKV